MKIKFLEFLKKIKEFILSHKILSVITVIILGYIVHFVFSSGTQAEVRYVTSITTKQTIVSSISASGQVVASNQIDLKAKSSGDVTRIYVKSGSTVKKGQTLFSLDTTDAEKAVRDAKTSLETAELDLQKFKQDPKDTDVLAANNAITDAENSKVDADKSVQNAYNNLLNSTFEAVPTSNNVADYNAPVISGNYILGKEGTISIRVYYSTSSPNFLASGLVSASGISSSITPQPIGDSGLYIKFPSGNNLVTEWSINIPNKKASNYVSNYNAYQSSLDNKESTIRNADLTIAQQKQKINDLYHPDAIDLRTKELAVQQKQDALIDAQTALSDRYIRAPFDGMIASIAAKVGDTAPSVLGSIITKQKIASISLNEVDIAKINLGQKVMLSFDAIEGLSIAGVVAEIDSLGTVTQGVVTYNVKISFDTDDDRVKSGMSVSASIITAVKQDVLSVPVSAVKTKNGSSYVEVFDTALVAPVAGVQGSPSIALPSKLDVEVGLSNDTNIEIVSGLKEGDIVVSRTITAVAKATTATTTPSLLGGGANRGAGGGGNLRGVVGR